MMGNIRTMIAGLFAILFVARLSAFGLGQNLAEVYKTGRVRLVEEIRVTDDALPKNALFENPRGVTVDAKGNVYVSDFAANHIKVFGPDGEFIRTLGQKGQGPGDLGWPESIEIANGRIVVREVMNERLSILALDGTFIKSVPFSPDARYGQLRGMRSLPDGRLIVFAEKGLPPNFAGRLPEEQNQAIQIYSADLETKRDIYEKTFRASRWGRNPETNSFHRVYFPYHPRLFFDAAPSGKLALGYSEKYEIEFYDPDKGRLSAISRPYARVKLDDDDKKAHFDHFKMAVFIDNQRKLLPKPPEYVVRLTEFPEFLPPYQRLIFDSEGNLWVQRYVESRASNIFDVFSPQGDFLSQIAVDGTSVEVFGRFAGRGLWQIERDADGIASLVKYRIAAEK